jgi:hypothetical protein
MAAVIREEMDLTCPAANRNKMSWTAGSQTYGVRTGKGLLSVTTFMGMDQVCRPWLSGTRCHDACNADVMLIQQEHTDTKKSLAASCAAHEGPQAVSTPLHCCQQPLLLLFKCGTTQGVVLVQHTHLSYLQALLLAKRLETAVGHLSKV